MSRWPAKIGLQGQWRPRVVWLRGRGCRGLPRVSAGARMRSLRIGVIGVGLRAKYRLIAMNIEPGTVSFENTANAFEYKTDKELKKAEFLFSSMGYASLVKLGTKLTPWMIRSGLPVKKIIRDTIFAQFVGGETLEETASVARKLGEYHVQVILDYGVEGGEEGEAGFEHACGEFIRVIEYAATQPNIPFMSIKVTGFARFGLLERLHAAMDQAEGPLMRRYVHALETLAVVEQEEWQAVSRRMQKICETAANRNPRSAAEIVRADARCAVLRAKSVFSAA